MRKSQEKHRHFILTNGRSGSNYVSNLVNNHPMAINYGEYLGNWTLPAKIARRGLLHNDSVKRTEYLLSSRLWFQSALIWSGLNHIRRRKRPLSKYWGRVETIGLKDFHVNVVKHDGLAEYLLAEERLRVIVVFRENVLERAVSALLLAAGGTVADRSNRTGIASTSRIEPPALLEMLAAVKLENEQLEKYADRFDESRLLRVSYEDDISDAATRPFLQERISDFLSLPVLGVSSDHKKIGGQSTLDRVGNRGEVESALRGTEWAVWLP